MSCGNCRTLFGALRAVLPFARSRAEDMHEEAFALQEAGDEKAVEACDLWEKADAAVSFGDALLAASNNLPPAPVVGALRDCLGVMETMRHQIEQMRGLFDAKGRHLLNGNGPIPLSQRLANAALFEAVPDLLSALEGLYGVLNHDKDGGYFVCAEAEPIVEEVRAALDKARRRFDR